MKLIYSWRQQEISYSPWPFLAGLSVFSMAGSLVGFFHLWYDWYVCLLAVSVLGGIASLWWRDIIRESTFQGEHSQMERKAFWVGFVLFVCSEIMLFVSFFWAFFHGALAPAVELGCVYPPVGVKPIPVYRCPLTMTAVLVGSGVLANWCLHCVKGNESGAKVAMLWVLVLSFLFTYLQSVEYYDSFYTMRDSVYGSVFFLTTGFHAMHVIAGTIFLSVQYWRLFYGHFSTGHHLGLEMSVWYWHFVDVIWIFVVVFLYGWGGW